MTLSFDLTRWPALPPPPSRIPESRPGRRWRRCGRPPGAALEQLQRERVLDQALDGALQRTRAERRVVSLLGDHALGLGRQLERDLALAEQLLEPRQLQLHDVLDLLRAERTEDDDVVDAVEELG